MKFDEVIEFIEKANFSVDRTEYVNPGMDLIRIIWKSFIPDDLLIAPKQMYFTFTFPFDIDSYAAVWEKRNPGKLFDREAERRSGFVRNAIANLYVPIAKMRLLTGDMGKLMDYFEQKKGFLAGKKYGF